MLSGINTTSQYNNQLVFLDELNYINVKDFNMFDVFISKNDSINCILNK